MATSGKWQSSLKSQVRTTGADPREPYDRRMRPGATAER
jgi:hypothetical protein